MLHQFLSLGRESVLHTVNLGGRRRALENLPRCRQLRVTARPDQPALQACDPAQLTVNGGRGFFSREVTHPECRLCLLGLSRCRP